MTSRADYDRAHARVRLRRTWSGHELDLLEQRPPTFPADVRWSRLTRFDRCTLGAAYAIDASTGGALAAAGMTTAAVIRTSWSSADGALRYMGRMTERYGGMFRDFAQMGGTSTYHYLAKCLGIRGYATVLGLDLIQSESDGIIDDVAQISDINTIFDIRIHLRWPAENKVINALASDPEQVQATLLTVEATEAG